MNLTVVFIYRSDNFIEIYIFLIIQTFGKNLFNKSWKGPFKSHSLMRAESTFGAGVNRTFRGEGIPIFRHLRLCSHGVLSPGTKPFDG